MVKSITLSKSIIDYIFKNKWNNINEMIEYLSDNNIQSFNQGFFTKVYKIDDFILKVNCGDPDFGFMEYKKYFTNNPSMHAPICYNYREIISNNKPHYVMLTEQLIPFPYSDPEHIGITCLRDMIRNNIHHKDVLNKYKNKLSDFDELQIVEIFNFFKDFDISGFNIDICSINLMLRKNIWIVNDPLVLLNGDFT